MIPSPMCIHSCMHACGQRGSPEADAGRWNLVPEAGAYARVAYQKVKHQKQDCPFMTYAFYLVDVECTGQ